MHLALGKPLVLVKQPIVLLLPLAYYLKLAEGQLLALIVRLDQNFLLRILNFVIESSGSCSWLG